MPKRNTGDQASSQKTAPAGFDLQGHSDGATDRSSTTSRQVQRSRADDIRVKLDQLGIEAQDIEDGLAWARNNA